MDAKYNRPQRWAGPKRSISHTFVCGFCGNKVASDTGWDAESMGAIRLCPECNFPTFFGFIQVHRELVRMVVPPSPPGRDVQNIPEPIKTLYAEARQSAGAGSYTASVLTCRKMLVDLACANGDEWKKGKQFWEYVKYLNGKLFAPDAGQVWINRIRDQGNKATHELGVQSEADAAELLRYVEMLLRLLYEFPQHDSEPIRIAPDTEAGAGMMRVVGSADGGAGRNSDS
jgi:Domain of unknown function (DUF4145)